MARNIGRPIKPDDKKKKVVSISLDPLHLSLLDQLAAFDDVTRSQMVRALIEGAGILGGFQVGNEEHKGNQDYKFPSGRRACNPHLLRGRCQNSACEATYRQEGL